MQGCCTLDVSLDAGVLYVGRPGRAVPDTNQYAEGQTDAAWYVIGAVVRPHVLLYLFNAGGCRWNVDLDEEWGGSQEDHCRPSKGGRLLFTVVVSAFVNLFCQVFTEWVQMFVRNLLQRWPTQNSEFFMRLEIFLIGFHRRPSRHRLCESKVDLGIVP